MFLSQLHQVTGNKLIFERWCNKVSYEQYVFTLETLFFSLFVLVKINCRLQILNHL